MTLTLCSVVKSNTSLSWAWRENPDFCLLHIPPQMREESLYVSQATVNARGFEGGKTIDGNHDSCLASKCSQDFWSCWSLCRNLGSCFIQRQTSGPSSSALSMRTGSGSLWFQVRFSLSPTWRHHGMKLGPSACKADAAPLSHHPSPKLTGQMVAATFQI